MTSKMVAYQKATASVFEKIIDGLRPALAHNDPRKFWREQLPQALDLIAKVMEEPDLTTQVTTSLGQVTEVSRVDTVLITQHILAMPEQPTSFPEELLTRLQITEIQRGHQLNHHVAEPCAMTTYGKDFMSINMAALVAASIDSIPGWHGQTDVTVPSFDLVKYAHFPVSVPQPPSVTTEVHTGAGPMWGVREGKAHRHDHRHVRQLKSMFGQPDYISYEVPASWELPKTPTGKNGPSSKKNATPASASSQPAGKAVRNPRHQSRQRGLSSMGDAIESTPDEQLSLELPQPPISLATSYISPATSYATPSGQLLEKAYRAVETHTS
ncbi:hypothetical protein N0V95_002870 [Ascochyta clinopodiicola]|nr:hypothetical protein N0V95_002870 [Ascochyta clinopodiicola]